MKVLNILIISLTLSIIVGGIMSKNFLTSSSNQLLNTIAKMEQSLKQEDWTEYMRLAALLKVKWEKDEKTWSILMDHHEIENITLRIILVDYYGRQKVKKDAYENLTELQFWLGHMPKIEELEFKNIF